MNTNNYQNAAIGLCGLLTITFTVLKLTQCITWSWLWTLSPLWVPVAVVLLVLAIFWLCQLWIYCKWRARR